MELGTVRQHLASLVCSLALATIGIALVWFAPLMLYIVSPESPVPMTTTQSSWLVCFINLGSVLAVLPANILSDQVGRKYPLLAIGPLGAITFLLMAYVRSLPVMFVLRIVQGICLGIAYGCGPIYIAEVSEPRLRGSTSSHLMTLVYTGCLFSYCWGPYVSYQNYAFICVLPCVLFTVTFPLMPESPYYLLMKGKKDEARQALTWLRGGKVVNEEINDIEDTVKRESNGKSSWKELFLTKKDRKAFLIVQLCSALKYSGGIPGFITYLSQTFGESTIRFLDHNQLTIVAGVLLTVSAFSSAFIGDKVGRRPMLIYSNLLCFVFHSAIGAYYFLDLKTDFNVVPYVWVLYVSIVGFVFATNVGLSPLMQTIQAEFFSSRTRGLGGGIAMIVGSSVAFVSMRQYQFIQDTVGVYLNYWIYAAISLFGAIFLYFLLPETAGKSLGEIQVLIPSQPAILTVSRMEATCMGISIGSAMCRRRYGTLTCSEILKKH